MKHANHWVFVHQQIWTEKTVAKQTAALKGPSTAQIAIKTLSKVHPAQDEDIFIDPQFQMNGVHTSKIHQPGNPFLSHYTTSMTMTMTITMTMVI